MVRMYFSQEKIAHSLVRRRWSLKCMGNVLTKTFTLLLLVNTLFIDSICAADRFWVASSSSNWNDINNWSTTSGGAGGASIPGTSDDVYFDGNGIGDCSIDAVVSILGLDINAAYTGNIIQQLGNSFTVGANHWDQRGGTFTAQTSNVRVNGNLTLNAATITHSDNSTTEVNILNLIVTGDLTLSNGGQVNVDGLGYDADNGTGKPTDGSGDGGAHGGIGGDNDLDGTTAVVYDVLGQEIGSGGDGASGGGAIALTISGALNVDATSLITANGALGSGGGSGGAINITTGTILVAGTISADGGDSNTSHGGGGGGRIVIYLTASSADFTNVSGTISAYGGDSNGTDEDGAAGLIYQEEEAMAAFQGDYVIDNNGLSANESVVNTPIVSGTHHMWSLSLKNNAVFACPSGTTFRLWNNNITSNDSNNKVILEGNFTLEPSNLTVDNFTLITSGTNSINIPGNLTITNGGYVSHSDNSTAESNYLYFTVGGNVVLSNNAQINADGLGYDADNGAGKPSDGSGDGGAYGGIGGDNDLDGTTAVSYGSTLFGYAGLAGIQLGSGGDDASGGGLIILFVSGELDVDATSSITANGSEGAGAGSGGGITIVSGTISVAGVISANGGDSNTSHGAGGGGRIWVELSSALADFGDVSGIISAYGGDSNGINEDGAAGIVYLEEAAATDDRGDVIIDNNGLSTNEEVVNTPFIFNLEVEKLILRNNATVAFPAGTIFTLGSDNITSNDSNNKVIIESGGVFQFPTNLTIDNWELSLGRNFDFGSSNTIVLQNNGVINLNGFRLTLDNSATSAVSADATSYIICEDQNATIDWAIDRSTGTYIFPFGTSAGTRIPLVFDVTVAGSTTHPVITGRVSFSTYATADNNTPRPVTVPSGSDYSKAIDRFWILDLTDYNAPPTIDFTFGYDENDLVGNVLDENDLAFEIYDEGLDDWVQYAGVVNITQNTLSIPSTSISPSAPQSNFIWTMGSDSNPLPIELLSFDTKVKEYSVELTWATSTEINNDYFTIEKSADGVSFQKIGMVDGAGNSNEILNYSFEDRNYFDGNNFYRLKQTDFDGTFSYSEVVSAETRVFSVRPSFTAYPNPVSGREIHIQASSLNYNELLLVEILDLNGSVVKRLEMNNDLQSIPIDSDIQNGTYLLVCTSSESKSISRVIVDR